jgi:putative glutathione S-transferase
MLEGGWHFVSPENAKKEAEPASAHSSETFPGATEDHLFGFHHLNQVYRKAEPDYDARFTVPTLWDTKNNTIVSNESSEVIRDLNAAFNSILPDGEKKNLDLYPENLRKEIDELNEWVYNDINNGVYKTGFAATQEAYETAFHALAKALDKVEGILSDGREFLVGGQLTEADVRSVRRLPSWSILTRQALYHYHPIRPSLLRSLQVQLRNEYVSFLQAITANHQFDTISHTYMIG